MVAPPFFSHQSLNSGNDTSPLPSASISLKASAAAEGFSFLPSFLNNSATCRDSEKSRYDSQKSNAMSTHGRRDLRKCDSLLLLDRSCAHLIGVEEARVVCVHFLKHCFCVQPFEILQLALFQHKPPPLPAGTFFR